MTRLQTLERTTTTTTTEWDREPLPLWLWLLPVVGLVVVAGWGLTGVRGSVEDDLRARAASALDAAGVDADAVDVELAGRDATLTGVLGSPEEVLDALAAVEAVEGVRVAEGLGLTVASDDTPDGADDAGASAVDGGADAGVDEPGTADDPGGPEGLVADGLVLAVDGDGLVLRGTVPDTATRDQLVALAAASVGADRVTDELVVGDTAAGAPVVAAGVEQLAAALAAGADLDGVTAAIDDGGVTLAGTVPARDVADDLVTAAAVSGAVDDRLEVAGDVAAAPTEAATQEPGDTGPARDGLGDGTEADPWVTYFDTNVTEVDDATGAVAEALERLDDAPSGSIVPVIGHADARGDVAANLALSRERAEAVAAELRAEHPDMVYEVSARGEDEPGADEEQSRRVEFWIE